MVKVLTALATAMLATSGCAITTAPSTGSAGSTAAAVVGSTSYKSTGSNKSTGFVSAGSNAVLESASGCVRTADWDGNLTGSCGGEAEPVVEVAPTPVVTELPAVSKEPVPKEPVYVRETLNGSALFELDSAELSAEGYQALEELVGRIGEVTGAGRIEIVGHTDDTGSEEYNQQLSARRAQNVSEYLQGRVGGLAVKASAKGELSPIADNSTEAGRAKNRRVEVLVSQNRIAQ